MAKGRRLHPRSGRGEPLKPAACRGHRKTHGAEVNLAHGKPAGGLRRAHRMGPGTRRPPGAGARALNPRGRIPGASGESGCWSWPPAGAAATCLLARRELARVRALTAGGLWIPVLQSLGPTFLCTLQSTAAPTPDSSAAQSCKETGCGRGFVGRVDAAAQPQPEPGPAAALRRSPLRWGASGSISPQYLLSELLVAEGEGRRTGG